MSTFRFAAAGDSITRAGRPSYPRGHGTPRLADVETGTSILRQLQRLSEPFAVRINIEKSNGRVIGEARWE